MDGGLSALKCDDSALAGQVIAADRAVDVHRAALLAELKGAVRTSPETTKTWLRLINSARNLELAAGPRHEHRRIGRLHRRGRTHTTRGRRPRRRLTPAPGGPAPSGVHAPGRFGGSEKPFLTAPRSLESAVRSTRSASSFQYARLNSSIER